MFTVMKFHGQFSPSERGSDAFSRTSFKTLNGYGDSCSLLLDKRSFLELYQSRRDMNSLGFACQVVEDLADSIFNFFQINVRILVPLLVKVG